MCWSGVRVGGGSAVLVLVGGEVGLDCVGGHGVTEYGGGMGGRYLCPGGLIWHA